MQHRSKYCRSRNILVIGLLVMVLLVLTPAVLLAQTSPAITPATPPAAVVDIEYSYQVQVTGSEPLTYSLNLTPTGMVINSGTGLITWTPDSGQIGSNTVEVQVDNDYGSDTEQFSIQVNQMPEITTNEVTTAIAEQLYQYDVDADGVPAPTYSLTITPAGMGINASSGLITWTPSAVQLGSHTVEVQAENTAGTDTQQFMIEVGTLPEITSMEVTTATVGQLYQYDVDASGVPAPTYSLVITPAGMTINPATGLINWEPSGGQTGSNAVQVRATNSMGTADQSFSIDVSQGPLVTSVPSDATITAGQSFNGTATASGSPAPTFSLINNTPDWLSIHPTSGAITGNSTQADAGINVVTVQAENTVGADSDSFTITVESTAICVMPETVSSWSFENNIEAETQTPDLLWSNNATCPYGSICPRDEAGLVGNAAAFNVTQSDRLSVDSPSLLDWSNSDDFSIQVWVNTTQDCTGNKVFVGKHRAGDSSPGRLVAWMHHWGVSKVLLKRWF